MTRLARSAAALALLGALAACHTDPFSIEPEVRGVTIPPKPAAETPSETAEPAEEAPKS